MVAWSLWFDGGGKMWLASGHISKGELVNFADELDVGAWKKWRKSCCWLFSLSICVYSVTQSCPTLSTPWNCSPPGSSVHGIFQAGILEWVAFPLPGDLRDLGIEPASPASLVLAGRLYYCATWVAALSIWPNVNAIYWEGEDEEGQHFWGCLLPGSRCKCEMLHRLPSKNVE